MADLKYKLAVINYTNSLPFVYGLENTEDILNYFDIRKDMPSACSDMLLNNTVDIALVSAITILNLPYYKIVSKYCISAVGEVKSVYIHSRKPIDAIESIMLDKESKTSNILAKILLKELNHRNIRYLDTDVAYPYDAQVVIGDKNFIIKEPWPYKYDLSEQWQKSTGKPFVFAVWLSNKEIPKQHEEVLNNALVYGVNNKEQCINKVQYKYPNIDIKEYLCKNIQYDLSQEKMDSLKIFLAKAKDII